MAGMFDDLVPGGQNSKAQPKAESGPWDSYKPAKQTENGPWSEYQGGAFDDLVPKSPEKSSLARRLIGDTAVSAVKGAIGLTEVPVGIADMAIGGMAGKALEGIGYRPKEAKAMLDEMYSPEQKAANKAVSDAEGFFGTAKAALQNPSTIGQSVIESAPLLLPGAAIARGVGAAGKIAPAVAGGIGEGVVGTGLAAEQMRQNSEDGTLSARQTGAALASGAGTAAFGIAGGKLAQSAIGKKLGLADVDTALAMSPAQRAAAGGIDAGIAKRIAGGAVSEGVLEELPQSMLEQAAQNYGEGKPIGEGVAEAGAMGALAGGVMGGGFNALQGRLRGTVEQQPPAQEAPRALPAPTYTGTPNDQTMAAEVERANQVAAAQANADAIYAERAAFEQERAPAKLPVTGPMSAAVNVGIDSGATSITSPANPRYEIPAQPRGSFAQLDELASLIGQERADVADRRELAQLVGQERRDQERRIAEAADSRRALDSALADTDQRAAGVAAQESEAARLRLLDNILSSISDTGNPARQFGNALRRAGYRNTDFTERERQVIQRFSDARAALRSPEATTVPAAPNELDAASLGIRERSTAGAMQGASGRDKIGEAVSLLSQGWKLALNKTLVSPTGKKRKLNAEEFAAVREARAKMINKTEAGNAATQVDAVSDQGRGDVAAGGIGNAQPVRSIARGRSGNAGTPVPGMRAAGAVGNAGGAGSALNAAQPEQVTQEAAQADGAQAAPAGGQVAIKNAEAAPAVTRTKDTLSDTVYSKSEADRVFSSGGGVRVRLNDGSSITFINLQDDEGYGDVHAYSNDGKRIGLLGYFTTTHYKGGPIEPSVHVEEQYRRKGIASAMYDIAEQTGGIIPDTSSRNAWRSEDGQAFRLGRDAKNKKSAATPTAKQSSPVAGNQNPIKKPAPIMRRDDLVGAIMRVTGGNGIAANMAQTIIGDKANQATKVRGLFQNAGTMDLDDTADLLRTQEGYDVRDGNHLAELIREQAAGNPVVSMERAERDAADNAEKEYRAAVNEQAAALGLKRAGGKRTLQMVEADIARIEAEIEAKERELSDMEAREERAAIQAESVYDEIFGADLNESDWMTWLSANVSGTYTQEEIDNVDRIQADREDARAAANTDGAADIETQAGTGGRQGFGANEAQAGGTGGRARGAAEGFSLTRQTNEQAAEQFARQQAGEPEAPTKEQADRERDAVPFSMQQQSQPKPQGVQTGLFTADGRVSSGAAVADVSKNPKKTNMSGEPVQKTAENEQVEPADKLDPAKIRANRTAAEEPPSDSTGQNFESRSASPADAEFSATERAYGGREAFNRAKAAGKTKLNYRQWVQVRTPKFKEWFGDWEALRAQDRLDSMTPVKVRVPDEWRELSHTELRGKMAEALDRMVKQRTEINHPDLGAIRVGRTGANKSLGTARDPAKSLVAADIEALIPSSIYARTEPSRGGDGQDIDGYSTLLARVSVDDVPLIAAFTVRHQSDGRWYYNAVTLHDAQEKAQDSYGRPDQKATGSRFAPITGLDSFIRQPLRRVNADSVSKVVDPETGEPLVVYHGTTADINEFRPAGGRPGEWQKALDHFKKAQNNNDRYGYMNFRDGSFFSPKPEYAGNYTGENSGVMYQAFVVARNPVYFDMSRKHAASGINPDKTPDALMLYSGDKSNLNEIAVIDPTQVKSATGNNGNFDGGNPDIRESRVDQKPLNAQQKFALNIVQKTADRFSAEYAGAAALDIRVVYSNDDIPEFFRPSPYAEGVYHDREGIIYLVASNLPTRQRAWQVLMHETVGHHGLANMMGDQFSSLLETVLKRAVSSQPLNRNPQPGEANYETVDAVRRLYPEASDAEVAQEVLARMAETMPNVGWFRMAMARIMVWLKNAAKAFGLKLEPTMADVRRLVELAGYHVRSGANLERSPAGRDAVFASRGTAMESRAATIGRNESVIDQMRNAGRRMAGADWSVSEPSKIDDLIYSLQDKQIDLKRVIQSIAATGKKIGDDINAYLQEELFHGRAAKGVKDFLDFELRPLLREMQMLGIDMGDFEEYLWNRHAEERNNQIAKINPDMPDGGSGINTADARAYLAELSADQKRKMEALAARIDQMNRNSQRILVESGLEKQETIDAWNGAYKHYVPLQREDVDSGHVGTGKGFSVRGSSSKRAMGSGKKVVDIIANLTQQRERNIVRAEKNRVSNALFGLAAQNPNPDFWKVDEAPKERVVQETAIYTVLDADGNKIDEFTRMAEAERLANKTPGATIDQSWADRVTERIVPGFKNRDNVILTRIGGEDHYVILNERDDRAMRLSAAMKNLDMDNMGRALSIVGKATRYLASVNTQYNPVFGVINLIRDVQGALLNLQSTQLAGEQKRVAGYTVDALRGIYADIRAHRRGENPSSKLAELFEEFQKEGGQTGYRDQYANAEARAEAIMSELNQFKEGKLKLGARAVFGWLSDYNETMENAVRLAAYKTAKEKGLSNQQAASIAKNLTVNFNRKGQMTTQIGALYAFFNASVQGTARMAETLFEKNDGDAKKIRLSKLGKRIISGGIMLGSMQAMLLAAAGFDDDEPPEFVRERNLILPTGDGKYLTLAMPLGFHVIPGIGRIATEFALSGFKDPAKRIVSMFGMFAETFNPVGSSGFSIQTLTPSIVDPFAALAENRDFTGREIYRENFNANDPAPGHTRAKDVATPWSRYLSESINFITGGTDFKPGAFSPSPDAIDYLIAQATGGVGREINKAAQTVGAAYTGDDLPLYKIPLVGRFVGDTEGQSGISQKFYNAIREINAHDREVKGLRESGRVIEAQEYIADNPVYRMRLFANLVENQVRKLRDARRKASDDGDSDRVRAINDQITRMMTEFNERAVPLINQSSTEF